jgi:hypothetical protein
MLKAREITRDLTAQRVARALRRYVGRGKEFSYSEFAELTGQDQRTVEAHCRGESAPHLFVWLKYAAVLPPAFAAELIEIVGLIGLREVGGTATAQGLHVLACDLNAMLARHLADGRVDHREAAEQEPVVRELHVMTGAWLELHQRGESRGATPQTPGD